MLKPIRALSVGVIAALGILGVACSGLVTPSDLDIQMNAPERIPVGKTGVVELTFTNQGKVPHRWGHLSFSESFYEGFEIVKIEPSPTGRAYSGLWEEDLNANGDYIPFEADEPMPKGYLFKKTLGPGATAKVRVTVKSTLDQDRVLFSLDACLDPQKMPTTKAHYAHNQDLCEDLFLESIKVSKK